MAKMKVIMLFLIGIFALTNIASAEVSTGLEISNVNIAPQLISNIPDQTWAINTNLTEAFDLDDFFIDNDEINYTASYVDSISILINETTRKVSFYPSAGFSGIRTVIFTASDGLQSSNSNTVTLNVTQDSIPPKWNSISIVPGTIRQNTIARFSANWEDNVALDSFILSINQGGTWINQTLTHFTGKTNTSTYSLQISAAASTTVYWQIFAFDTSGNMNSTTIRNFTVQTTAYSPPSNANDDDEDESSSRDEEDESDTSAKKGFNIDPAEGFQIEMIKGEEKTISFRIINTATTTERFTIELLNLDKFEYTLNKNNFTLSGGSSEIITLNLKSKTEAIPDIYYGIIAINTYYKKQKIPLLIQLNTLVTRLGLNVTILDKKEFLPLQEITSNITLNNLQDVQSAEIYFYYAITDFNGKIIDSASEQFILNSRSINLQRSLKIPEDTPIGDYVFLARAITNGSITIDSDSFMVGKRTTLASFILKYIWMIIIITSIVITILIAITEYRNRRKLNLLNMYIMTSELSRLVKENNFIEAQKVYIKIKNTYNETIPEEIFNNPEKLNTEIKLFAEKIDQNLYNQRAIQTTQTKEENSEENKKESNPEEKEEAKENTEEETTKTDKTKKKNSPKKKKVKNKNGKNK